LPVSFIVHAARSAPASAYVLPAARRRTGAADRCLERAPAGPVRI